MLVHALGNAGHPTSVQHIVSYMEADKATPSLRRAAAYALRHFSCNKSADALLESAVNDPENIVKQAAYEVYSSHPAGKSFTYEQENIILAARYSYPVVTRVRRGTFADILKALSFELVLPKVDWRKVIGSNKIGASFGIIMENYIKLKLAPFSGLFDLKVHDEAWATANLGLINQFIDIFRVKVCYQINFHYDLNILKDFGIDSIQHLASAFDRLYHKIVDPIKEAVDLISDLIDMGRNHILEKMITDLVQLLKDLPSVIKEMAENIWKSLKKINNFDGNPLVDRVKKLINRIKVFIDDVKGDILGFYHSVADAITVSLPFVGKEIKEGFELIGDSWKFWENPIASFHGMENALLKFKLAVVTFVEAKERVMDSLNVFKGGLPYWFHPIEEVKGMMNDVMDIMGLINDQIFHYKTDPAANFSEADITDGLMMCENKKNIHDLVKDAVMPVVNQTLGRVREIAKPFWDKVTEVIDLFKRIKSSYDFVREAINKGKFFIQKIFGAKFHRKFPKTPGPCDPSCACGEYKKKNNGRMGLDLMIDSKSKMDVHNPMTGLVSWYGDTEVLINPHRVDVNMYEIIVSNLEQVSLKLPRNRKKKFFLGGHKIGRVVDNLDKCEFNYITVYMRKRVENSTGMTEDDYEYIDPSKYIKKKKPKSFWKPVCKEAFYHYIGHVADDLDMGDEPEEDETETTREVDSKKIKGPKFLHRHHVGKRSLEIQYTRIRNKRAVECNDENEKSFKCKLKKFGTKLGEMRESLIEKTKGAIMPGFDIFDISISEIQSLQINRTLMMQLNNSILSLSKAMKEAPIEYPDSLPIHRIKHKLREAGADYHDIASADRLTLVDNLLTKPLEECPSFLDAVALEYGHMCDAHKDCLGLTCGAVFKEGYQRHLIKFTVRWNPCRKKFEVSFDGMKQLTRVSINETKELSHGLNGETRKDIAFLMSATARNLNNGKAYFFNMSGSLCISDYFSCYADVNILSNLQVHKVSTDHCEGQGDYDPYIARIRALNLQDLIEETSEFGLDIHSLLILVNKLREEIIKEIMSRRQSVTDAVENAFPAAMDLRMSKFIPLGHIDITIFEINFLFMVGPIPLHLSFGAGANIGADLEISLALMSLQANGTVIPRIGAIVWGELNVDIGIAYGGIRLEGHLVQTSFPISISLTFSKFPIATAFKLDLVLVPLELRLKAHAKLRLLFVSVTVFDACIWRYKMDTIRKNLITTEHKKKDDSPPNISHVSQNTRRKRSGEGGCDITQFKNRDPTDPAFLLEVSADDEVSDVTLTYAIGTHRGGSNVVNWTGMKGSSLTAPVTLPNGIPLYWTVKAINSNGGTAVVECSLDTYDNTIPDGRIEASYPFTSHPSKLSGTVIVFDDSQLIETHSHSVGFSQGEFGNEVVNWDLLLLHSTHKREGSTDKHLQYFTVPREGKLTSMFMRRIKVSSADECAENCINYGEKCISFDFEFHTETCDLQSVIEGPNAELRISGTYKNYERLGLGYDAFVSYNISLQHGMKYFINAEVTNDLGYKAFITSKGTMVDYTPPEPVNVGNTTKDYMTVDACNAAITQRCVDVTPRPNNRRIIDGLNASTVFNGHESLKETLYTLTNHFVSANFDSFLDKESGIFGYTWAVGRHICGTDISPFADPHAHLSSPKFWTNTGYARDVHLSDGQYYVTVQALNNVVHGGSLVTTVCHSVPLTVDTSPPEFKGLTDIIFDEDFNLMAIYFGAEDKLSKIARVDFGLGKTKHDVEVRGYSKFDYKQTENPYIVIKDLNLTDGEPAWIRLRAVNNVELFTAGHSDDPILIDRTKPNPGKVLDGSTLDEDEAYQSKTDEICASWKGFYDPESGISQYTWGVGTEAGKDDIVSFIVLSRDVKEKCSKANLTHNTEYFSTVVAKNSALNPKTTKSSSDGVKIDTTLPVTGYVNDGDNPAVDIEFSSETAEFAVNWGGFKDPESEIAAYVIHVFVNGEKRRSFVAGLSTTFKDFSMSFLQGDHVKSQVTARNRAGLESSITSSGFIVDLSPPVIQFIYSAKDGRKYQTDNSSLSLSWLFIDPESGIKMYRYTIYDFYQGTKTRKTEEVATNMTSVHLALQMLKGHRYSVKVIAVNNADMPISQESEGVMIDTSPPNIREVHIGLINVPEDTLDNGTVMHADEKRVTISFRALDTESGISKIFVALVDDGKRANLSDYQSFVFSSTIDIENLNLKPSNVYRLFVIVENGAGINSTLNNEKTIYIMKKNVPGVVFDGRQLLIDEDFTKDRTSLAMSFVGFESESCNIVQYEWAIGYQPFVYDVLPFTDYGIVMHNESFGQGQMHLRLYEDSTYYITVRARTGYNCKVGQYIVSTSDGIKLDTTPPEIKITEFGGKSIASALIGGTLYLDRTDAVSFRWNSSDSSGIAKCWWSMGSLPGKDDLHKKKLTTINFIPAGATTFSNGQTFYLNIGVIDNAGNGKIVTSPAITIDTTAPVIKDYHCTPFISERRSLVECQWDMVQDQESMITKIFVGVGKNETTPDISEFHEVPMLKRNWIRDMHTKLKNNPVPRIYIIIKIINGVDMTTVTPYEISVDRTPPEKGIVEIITTLDRDQPQIRQLCQIPQTFIEVRTFGWVDKESELQRYEVAVGTDGKTTNIKDFIKIENPEKFLINNIFMPEGSKVYVTVRSFNKAGLYGQMRSDPVVISSQPSLRVVDGPSDDDTDFQSSLGVLQGRWLYSDPCEIISAEWSVEMLDGSIFKPPSLIPKGLTHFYSDVVTLQNGITYINVVKTTDALNRTRTSRSNGVAVKIQPPVPGDVRDGVQEDINYQESVTSLSANWDAFGKSLNTRDPTQQIVYYEVAIGNDRRFPNTRTNIHYFENVGLNTTYTFTGLNLTAKIVKYYITVRAMSRAGSTQESYSNGIRVGYRNEIIPGEIEYSKIQSSTSDLAVSWTGFQADLGIDYFRIGLSSFPPNLPNETLNCVKFNNILPELDQVPVFKVQRDTFFQFKNLHLNHNHTYFVVVVATDVTGRCVGVYGDPVLIDTTPPKPGSIFVQGSKGDNVLYSTAPDHFVLEWDPFKDEESKVKQYEISIFSTYACSDKEAINAETSDLYTLVKEDRVENDNKIVFYDLQLKAGASYIGRVKAWNEAGLEATIISKHIRFDFSSPIPGALKKGKNWFKELSFQPFTSHVGGLIAISNPADSVSFRCESQEVLIPLTSKNEPFSILDKEFSPKCIEINEKYLKLIIRHDDNLKTVIKGGVLVDSKNLRNGNYTVNIKSVYGFNMVSTLFFGSDINSVVSDFEYTPEKKVNSSFKELNDKSDSMSKNITDSVDNEDLTMTTASMHYDRSDTTRNSHNHEGYVNHENTTDRSNRNSIKMGKEGEYSFGVHLPGYQFEDNWVAFFWIKDKYRSEVKQVVLEYNPTTSGTEFSFSTTKTELATHTTWGLRFFINGVLKGEYNGLTFSSGGIMGFYNWNKDNYFPPISDPDSPVAYKSVAVISDLKIPLQREKPCMHGLPFSDTESGIKEIFIGLSDSKSTNNTASISPFSKFKTFCKPCSSSCNIDCDPLCKINQADFNILPFTISNVSLKHATIDKTDIKSNGSSFHAPTYYINVKVINYAGLETVVSSDAVMVDISPPVLDFVRCLDPADSMDAPSLFQGTNKSMAAYWDGSEDVGDIVAYNISIGTTPGGEDIYNKTGVGLATKIKIDDLDGKLYHDHTYFITVTAINSADLTASKTCNITVETKAPDISGLKVKLLLGKSGSHGRFTTENSRELGITWIGGKADVEFYEWQVGSTQGGDDVFPRVKIGLRDSTKAAIQNGELRIDDKSLNASVGEYAKRNWTEETLKEAKANHFFNMEPGLCLYITLFAVGRSHLSSSRQIEPFCIKRNIDREFTAHKRRRTSNQVHIGRNLEISPNGGVLSGILKETAYTEEYGSAASESYIRYIVNPTERFSDTSRFLRNRIISNIGPSFYITPTEESVDVITKVGINSSDFDVNMNIPDLAYWDKEMQKWISVEEKCKSSSISNSILQTTVCSAVFQTEPRRNKRSAGNGKLGSHPRMFTVMKIKRDAQNNRPIITTNGPLHYQEDNITNSKVLIESYDIENDSLNYSIEKSPSNGRANISSDGWFIYVPNKDFSGNDSVKICVTEVNVSSPFVATKSCKSFDIDIAPTNDDPTIEFHPQFPFPFNSSGDIHTIVFESNVTRENIYGIITAEDIDKNNNLTIRLINSSTNQLSSFKLTKSGSNHIQNSISSSHVEMYLSHHLNKEFSGLSEVKIRAHDDQLDFRNMYGYSREITIQVFVLKNPCVHGRCINRTGIICADTSRAYSFDLFACDCSSGYTGEWCETDINECYPNPCSVFYDCKNLIGRYDCVLNGPKTFGLAIGFLFIIGFPVMLFWRHLKKRRPSSKVSDSMFLPPSNKRLVRRTRYSPKFSASKSDIPTTSNDETWRKSFPFESEEQRMSAMNSLAEHNANLRKNNTPLMTETAFKKWAMPRKKVFTGSHKIKRDGVSSSESGIPEPPHRVATPSGITDMFSVE
ncbi:uncharacterized protein LOC133205414 [Saccostrea echinata]|uniref:uncharacterized protein LOC133205414 n=1 Tax=Saccostrea echinata TaxID=191078 RepID=UPI002A81FA0E|nr:uncharacterized protein LOC133205414 [Saccostrea echinata]